MLYLLEFEQTGSYQIKLSFVRIIAPRGALQPSMGEILSRDVTLLTCRQKIIVIVNIMGEIL